MVLLTPFALLTQNFMIIRKMLYVLMLEIVFMKFVKISI